MSETKNIYQRLNAVRENVAYLQKDAQVQGYKAVSHDLVTSAAREHLIANGVMIVPRQAGPGDTVIVGETKNGSPIIRYQAFYEIDFVNCDQPDDKATVSLEAHANDHGDKAPGKACSYAVKYAMLKLFSIETGENEESRVEVAKKMQPIDDDQAAIITEKLNETGADVDRFIDAMGRAFSCRDVKEISQIPSFLFKDVVRLIDNNAKRKQPEGAPE